MILLQATRFGTSIKIRVEDKTCETAKKRIAKDMQFYLKNRSSMDTDAQNPGNGDTIVKTSTNSYSPFHQKLEELNAIRTSLLKSGSIPEEDKYNSLPAIKNLHHIVKKTTENIKNYPEKIFLEYQPSPTRSKKQRQLKIKKLNC